MRRASVPMLSVVAALLLVCAAGVAKAAERVALVVGNGAYEHTVPLANPVNDAGAIAAALERLGFAVVVATDGSQAAMEASIRDLARQARGAELALFFYAGHGLQVNGINYLIPVDAVLESEDDLVFGAIDLNDVLGIMTRSAQASLVFLDACRDNPMADELARSMGTRSTNIGRGLAQVDSAVGALIAYATQPGNVALDGQDEHSPFTAALLEHMETPGLELRQVLTRVRDAVVTATDGQQVPWDHSSLRGDVYLVPASAAPVAVSVAPPTVTSGAEVWQVIQFSNNPKDFEIFLRSFPDSPFAPYARVRLESLTPAEPSAAELAAAAAREAETRKLQEALAAEAAARAAAEAELATAEQRNQAAEQALAAAQQQSQAAVALEVPAEATPTVSAAATDSAAAVQLAALQSAETALGLDKAARQRVQQALTLLGYDTHGADGAFGKRSRAALASFQTEAGLEATGYLDRNTHDRLLGEASDQLAAWDAAQAARTAQKVEASAEASGVPAAIPAASAPAQELASAVPAAVAPLWAGTWSGTTELTLAGWGKAEISVEVVDGAIQVRFAGPKVVTLRGRLDEDGSFSATGSWTNWGAGRVIVSGGHPTFQITASMDENGTFQTSLTLQQVAK